MSAKTRESIQKSSDGTVLVLTADLTSSLWFQVLLGFPRPLQQGGGAAVPGSGVVLSESSAGSSEERRQSDVSARV